MNAEWLTGRLCAGHGVASGKSNESPYPDGTIRMQTPVFLELGLDLTDCYFGTLNVDFSPLEVSLSSPDYLFEKVRWTELHPPETFSFWSVQIKAREAELVEGWIYYPHPETKQRHWQPPTSLELIAPRLTDVNEGCTIHLHDERGRIKLVNTIRLRARLLEFLKFRVLASQQTFFEADSLLKRQQWLSSMYPEALQLSEQDLDQVWTQARSLYTES
uniref:hypothetical protein n=1 Tax=Synechococcus sp. UW106 TaxID=368495 RepID=UPI000E0FAB29|nr:hypothetical protein [Synechococcus sp. UW106]